MASTSSAVGRRPLQSRSSARRWRLETAPEEAVSKVKTKGAVSEMGRVSVHATPSSRLMARSWVRMAFSSPFMKEVSRLTL